MRREFKTICALALVGTLACAGPSFALEGTHKISVHRHHLRHKPADEVRASAPSPASFWDTGTVNGLSYDPRYCLAPGSCVYGYHTF